ncbi:transglutaminase family protein [Celeribacter sp.]|uniref:transglutaminase family protein n=1 Tax=Celeribacter sp. TaxID=1890673 RepID=UPI003A942E73
MHLTIKHTTTYTFEGPVTYALQQLRKTPKSTHQQTVLEWETRIEGGEKQLSFEDHHNNTVELIGADRDVERLIVTSEGRVEINDGFGVVGPHLGPAPLWLYQRQTPLTRAGQGVRALARTVEGDETLDRLHNLSNAVRERVEFVVGISHADWTAEQVLAEGRGVCQDHTHVFIACARDLDIPARYVSGYLMLDDRIEQDAMHAWAEAYVEGLGWVAFDVANGISPDTRYVRVATGLDYTEAAPVTGTRIGGAGESLSIDIEVAQQ